MHTILNLNKIAAFLAIILLFPSCEKKEDIVEELAKHNVLECRYVGLGGSPSSFYSKFERLKNLATEEELIAFLDHDSLAVVGYASYALIDRNLVRPDSLLKAFIENDGYVSTNCGCIASVSSLSSLIYYRFWNSEAVDYDDDNEIVIKDSKNLLKMDSVVLFSSNPDWMILRRALENRIYSEDYRDVIEELAFVKHEFEALNYVFKNMRHGNENALIESLTQVANNDDLYDGFRDEARNLLGHLR